MHILPFFALCDDMPAMLVHATHWLSLHLYMLSYMSMYESYLLVCRSYFNIMKLWTSDPNLHFVPHRHHLLFVFLLVCLFACLSSFLFACLPIGHLAFLFVCLSCGLLCLLPYAMLAMSIMLICFMPLSHALCIFFLPLLVCWFLVFVFACTHMEQGHMEQGRMELGHGLPGASKKGKGASM